MLKIIFYIKSEKIKLNGESPIYCKIKLNNESVSLSTGKSISSERWNSTNRLRNLLKLEKEKILKKSLELFLLKIEKKYNDLITVTNDISINILKNEILGVQKKS